MYAGCNTYFHHLVKNDTSIILNLEISTLAYLMIYDGFVEL